MLQPAKYNKNIIRKNHSKASCLKMFGLIADKLFLTKFCKDRRESSTGMMQLGKKCLKTYLNDDMPICRLTLSCFILLIYRSPSILLWIKTNHRDKIDQRAQIDA